MHLIKVAIVDDHKIIRDGLIALLKSESNIDIAGDFPSGEELFEFLKTQTVNLVLLDMHMPLMDGIEVTKELKANFPKVKILINSMSEMPDVIEKAVAAGVNGYLVKTSGGDELIRAMDMVANGHTYYGAAVINNFVKNVTKRPVTSKGLTLTETKIVQLVYEEKQKPEIMERLDITKATLTAHFQNIFRKLQVKTEMGVVKYALKEKWIE